MNTLKTLYDINDLTVFPEKGGGATIEITQDDKRYGPSRARVVLNEFEITELLEVLKLVGAAS